MNSSTLLKRLKDAHLKEHKCEKCGLTEWQGEYITLHLHHKDGNHNNNKLDNLEVLCPNCHSQTDSFAGKNTNKNKKEKIKIIYSPVIEESNKSNLVSEKTKENLCTICNKEMCFNGNIICRKCKSILIARKKKKK